MSTPPFPAPEPTLPVIVNTGEELRKLTDQAWDACLAANSPPTYFRFGDTIAQITTDGAGHARVRNATPAVIYGWITRSARWMAESDAGLAGSKPPRELSADFLAYPDRRLPILSALVHAPVLTRAGTILIPPGYDPVSTLYYSPTPGFVLPQIPWPPSATDLQAAIDLIVDFFADFPFARQADRDQAIGSLVSPLVRHAVDGPFPLHGVEASSAGAGKGLLVDCISIIATGEPVPITTLANDEAEARKKITSLLARSSPIVCIDNVTKMDSPQLAAVTTSTIWSDRLLGHTQQVDLPNRAIWLYTGNNPRLSGEIARRTVRIRLAPPTERPWERTGFRHPNLRAWVKDNRARLVHAVLILILNWIAKGRPAGSRSLGSFEAWASVVGGILEAAGATQFLADRDDFGQDSDPASDEWRAFVATWAQVYGGQLVPVSHLLSLATGHQALVYVRGEGSWTSQLARIGRALQTIRDRVFDQVQVVGQRSGHAKAWVYSLRQVTP